MSTEAPNTEILNGPGKSDLMLSLLDGQIIIFNFSFIPPKGWITEKYISALKATKKKMLQDLDNKRNIAISHLDSELSKLISIIMSSSSKKQDRETLVESINRLYDDYKKNQVLSTWEQTRKNIISSYDTEIDKANGKQKFIITSLETKDDSRNNWLFKACSFNKNQKISGYYNSNKRTGNLIYE